MAINKYFEIYSQTPEQDLFDDLTAEAVQQNGLEFFYIPRIHTELDTLFGEDKFSRFETSYQIELYMKTTEQFGNTPDFITSLGQLGIKDSAVLLVSRKLWKERLSGSNRQRPMEGDLLYFPLTKTLFEVMFVQDQSVFFQVGGLYTWDITVQLFEYSNERLRTGIPEIDSIEDRYVAAQELIISSLSGTFKRNETVYQGTDLETATFKAEVVSYNNSTGRLKVKHYVGDVTNTSIKGATSNATANVTDHTFNDEASINEKLQDNKKIQDEADTIIDWDPRDPFKP